MTYIYIHHQDAWNFSLQYICGVFFAGKVFQQTLDIQMGTNCAPLFADIFLHSYKAEFIQSLLSTGKKQLASRFNITYKYINDVSTTAFLVTLGRDYRRFNRYLESLVKFKVCGILLPVPEYIPPNLVKIHAQIKKLWAIQILNSAFRRLGLGLPLLVTTYEWSAIRMFNCS